MRHVKLFENFKEGPIDKPKGFFSKIAQGAKHAFGFEKAEDRKNLDTIHNALSMASQYDWIKNVRELEPGVVVASIVDRSLLVNTNLPEIMYKGQKLDLHNLQSEADLLYHMLIRIKNQNK